MTVEYYHHTLLVLHTGHISDVNSEGRFRRNSMAFNRKCDLDLKVSWQVFIQTRQNIPIAHSYRPLRNTARGPWSISLVSPRYARYSVLFISPLPEMTGCIFGREEIRNFFTTSFICPMARAENGGSGGGNGKKISILLLLL